MNATGARAETEASVERVKAWKQHRTGRNPPFSDDKVYYRHVRWGPFSYWTWRGFIGLGGVPLPASVNRWGGHHAEILGDHRNH